VFRIAPPVPAVPRVSGLRRVVFVFLRLRSVGGGSLGENRYAVPRLEVASPFLLELPAVQPPGDEVEHSGIVEPGEAHVPVIADARERAPRALELALGVARSRGEFVVVVFRVDVRPSRRRRALRVGKNASMSSCDSRSGASSRG
jgi:hypothetical protein